MSNIYQGYDSGGIPDDWKPIEFDYKALSHKLMVETSRQQRQINWLIHQLIYARIRAETGSLLHSECIELEEIEKKVIDEELKEIE